MRNFAFGLGPLFFGLGADFDSKVFGTLSSKTFESFRPRDLKGCEASPLPLAHASLPTCWQRCARDLL